VNASETVADRRSARFAWRLSLSGLDPELPEGSVANLETYFVQLNKVLTSWSLLALASGLALVGLGSIGSLLAGTTGTVVATSIGVACTAFCLVGAADATGRSLLIFPVRRRYRHTHDMTNRGQRALRIATGRYPTVAVQVVVGAACAVCSAIVL
jgi:hypothetical protein